MQIDNQLGGNPYTVVVTENELLLLLSLYSTLQTPTGRARCQKLKGPSREDSPVRKEKTLERKENNSKTKQQPQKVVSGMGAQKRERIGGGEAVVFPCGAKTKQKW